MQEERPWQRSLPFAKAYMGSAMDTILGPRLVLYYVQGAFRRGREESVLGIRTPTRWAATWS